MQSGLIRGSLSWCWKCSHLKRKQETPFLPNLLIPVLVSGLHFISPSSLQLQVGFLRRSSISCCLVLGFFLDLEGSIHSLEGSWSPWFACLWALTPRPLAQRGKAVPEDGVLLCQLNETWSTQWKAVFTYLQSTSLAPLYGDTLGCFRALKGLLAAL